MPNIDPAALSRSDSTPIASITPSLLPKSLPNPATTSQKTTKSPQPGLRVDVEPLYTALKAAIGSDWSKYKESVSQFILGHRNQKELARLTDHIIATDDTILHLHNQLICAIHCNVTRDAPESGVATWVSANDKPTSVSKPVSGDASEQRLKSEVMQLPLRIRHRLKGIQDEPARPLTASLLTHRGALRPHPPPSTSLSQPASVQPSSSNTGTTTTGGLNNDLEIRRRYTAPLPSETLDLPSSINLSDRLLPICYEEGLPSGPANSSLCAELLASATETFIKEALGGLVGKSRVNAPISSHIAAEVAAIVIPGQQQQQLAAVGIGVGAGGRGGGSASGIMTAGYKRKWAREEAACMRGEVKRSDMGLLPCEVVAAREQGRRGDLKVAWEVGDFWLESMLPWLGERVLCEEFEPYGGDIDVVDDVEYAKAKRKRGKIDGAGPTTNGVPHVNGAMHDDHMDIDEEDWGWQGARSEERDALALLLDDCLAVGQ